MTDQPDHPMRAARAALAIRSGTDRPTVVSLGARQLKGKREPVPIYRLVSVTS